MTLHSGHGGLLVAASLVLSSLIAVVAMLHITVVLAAQFLQRLALGLGDKQTGDDPTEHEQSEDLHDVVEPGGLVVLLRATVDQRTEHALGDDSSDLARGSADAVRGGSVAGREALARNNEGGGVGSEVEEELGQDVEGKKTIVRVLERLIGKADDNEQNGQDDEPGELNGLPADSVDSGNSDPVAGDGTSDDQNQVTNGVAVEGLVHVLTTSPTDCTQNDGIVQAQSVERCDGLACQSLEG